MSPTSFGYAWCMDESSPQKVNRVLERLELYNINVERFGPDAGTATQHGVSDFVAPQLFACVEA